MDIVRVSLKYALSFRDCLDEVARESRMLAFPEAPPMKSIMSFLIDNIDKGYPQFFAVESGEVVGWVDINPFSPHGQQHRAALGLGVRKSHRGRGVGRRLMSAALEEARAKGYEKVELDVFVENESAIALYRDFGFREEGRIEKFRKIEGRYQDVLSMALFL